MPNWIEGVLKIRGTKENVENFLRKGIDYNDYKTIIKVESHEFEHKPIPRDCKIKIDDDEISITNTMDLWIKGTRRMFVNSESINHWWRSKDPQIVCIDVREAWGIDAELLAKLSKEFGVDFKIFGTECGMEFCQDVEVVNGQIVKNQEIEFDDFEWECADPRLGG